ncbi:MAG: hydrogenase maturation nickel metallochaperone HypA [Pirellulaceae bacterium]
MSLVKSLLSQVDAILADNGADAADEIAVEIGPLSGVETELVQSAFEQLTNHPNRPSPRLIINQVPLVVTCRECHQESELGEFVFRCGLCNSGRVQVIRGDEFRLLTVTFNESTADV